MYIFFKRQAKFGLSFVYILEQKGYFVDVWNDWGHGYEKNVDLV